MQHQLTVSGMTCGHCEKAVLQAIRSVDPQAQVKIDRTQNRVEIASAQARAVLVQAIADEGYRVEN